MAFFKDQASKKATGIAGQSVFPYVFLKAVNIEKGLSEGQLRHVWDVLHKQKEDGLTMAETIQLCMDVAHAQGEPNPRESALATYSRLAKRPDGTVLASTLLRQDIDRPESTPPNTRPSSPDPATSRPSLPDSPATSREKLRELLEQALSMVGTIAADGLEECWEKVTTVVSTFENYQVVASRQSAFSVSAESELMAAFNVFDRDKSGKVTAAKLEAVCHLSYDVPSKTYAKVIAEFDGGKGYVTFEEFCALLGKYGESFGVFDRKKREQLEQLLSNREGASPFMTKMKELFPGALQDGQYVDKLHSLVAPFGFSNGTCIACVSLCRDEITDPLAHLINRKFGSSFTFDSLGGMLTCGKTGFGAAHHHAPIINNRERYLYVAMPHIGVDAFGNVGVVRRSGRVKDSSACGALIAFHTELLAGKVRLGADPNDIEQCHLKTRLVESLDYGVRPSLAELTKVAMKTILADLEGIIKLTVDTANADYAVSVGVQVHGPPLVDNHGHDNGDHRDFVWAGPCYVVCNGVKTDLTARLPN